MTRKRREDESFDDYRAALKSEDAERRLLRKKKAAFEQKYSNLIGKIVTIVTPDGELRERVMKLKYPFIVIKNKNGVQAELPAEMVKGVRL